MQGLEGVSKLVSVVGGFDREVVITLSSWLHENRLGFGGVGELVSVVGRLGKKVVIKQ
jgi:hypothetical protein